VEAQQVGAGNDAHQLSGIVGDLTTSGVITSLSCQ
jgi:hypothetical protein